MAFPKQKKIVLTGENYKMLQLECFSADKWRCKVCNKIKPLQMHHVQPRSKGRLDVLENVLSVCAEDHEAITLKKISVEWVDAECRIIHITPFVSKNKST